MPSLDRETWQRLQPLLDQALDLDEDARAAFLAVVRATAPESADQLASLLAAHAQVATSDFLSARPAIVEAVAQGLSGRTIGAYTLDRTVGMGGMGTVWLAHRSDGRFTGQVALKLVNHAVVDIRARSRFEREGTILARLTHPNIARLLDAGVTSRGQPYLVLEYVEGVNIDQFADDHRLGVRARLELFLQVADAVAHAHANLVVHRDLKPSNILVRADGVVKLLDFGIAKLLTDETTAGNPGATHATAMVLTPKFAAPEQARDGTVTTATDVYALGVLLFHLLAGQHPTAPKATTPGEFLRALEEPPGRLEAVLRSTAADGATAIRIAAARGTTIDRLRRACRGDLDTIVNTALKTDPADRYASVGAFAADLRRHLRHEPVSAQPDSWWYRTRKLVVRRRLESVAAAVAVVGVLSGAAVAVSQARVAATERDSAMRQLGRAQALNDLNEFLLTDAAPVGKPFTAGDVLARAERIAVRQQGAFDDTRVLTLVAIGRQYTTQDEDDNARRTLGLAYERAQALQDPSVRAQAGCAYAVPVSLGGDDTRARAIIRDAIAQLPSDALFAVDRATCALHAAEIEREGTAPEAAIPLVRSAASVLSASGLGTPLLHLRIAMDLAESYRAAGRYGEAAAAFADAFGQLDGLGRGDTETAGTLLNNWALTLQTLGQPLEAERLFRRAVEIASADGTDASVSPILLTNLARPLIDLGRLDEGLEVAGRAAAIAERDGNVVAANQGLLLRANGYRQRGDFQRAAALLDEFELRARPALPAGHGAFTVLRLDRARLALAMSNLAAARAGADAAVSGFDQARVVMRDGLWRALLLRAEVALAEHHVDAALADAVRAIAVQAEALSSTTSSLHVGRAQLTLGRALRAAGRDEEADAAFASAVRHLEATVGPTHALAREARDEGRQRARSRGYPPPKGRR